MKYTHSLFVFLFVLLPLCGFAQEQKQMSDPLDMRPVGWNKVLCMKNGNTLLFHFEPSKPLELNVFDSSHRLVAMQKLSLRLLEESQLLFTELKGLYEVNGEAVLFADQEHLRKHVLVMVRFNGNNGMLIEEKIAGQSPSSTRRTDFTVMKNVEEEGYSILFATDNAPFKKCDVHVSFYGSNHELLRDVPVPVKRSDYDYFNVVSGESLPQGVCITTCLQTLIENSTGHTYSEANTISMYNHTLYTYFIPTGSSIVAEKGIDLKRDVYPYYSNCTFNPFVSALNILLFSYYPYNRKEGLDFQPAAMLSSLFLSIDTASMAVKHSWVKNEMANVYYKAQTDSTKLFEGIPIKMYTNDVGLTTVIYQAVARRGAIETKVLYGHEDFFGNIGISQFDDEGKELWGTVVPNAQYYKSYQNYYHPFMLSKKSQHNVMFDNDAPEQVYNRQFVSVNTYTRNRDYYIIYNDKDKNFNNSMSAPGDTVYDFGRTNACYYKLGRGKVVTKHYVFGTPAENEYTCSFIEGADFDAKRGVYAALVQYKKNDEVSLRMAWGHLE
jgi:hypothetical protein